MYMYTCNKHPTKSKIIYNKILHCTTDSSLDLNISLINIYKDYAASIPSLVWPD